MLCLSQHGIDTHVILIMNNEAEIIDINIKIINTMATSETELFLKGLELNERILDLSNSLKPGRNEKNKLVLSFDLYCVLIKYFILIYQEPENIDSTLEELLSDDNLKIEVGDVTFTLEVNFFSPPNTIIIR